jgi:hypothetical protein
MDHQTMGKSRIRPAWIVAAGLAVLALLAIGVPLVSLLYVGILLLCPLLMAGMHGGHGGHGGHGQAHGHDAYPEEPGRVESTDPGGPSTQAAGGTPDGGPT